MTRDELELALETALRAALSARSISIGTDSTARSIQIKSDDSIVTDIDHAVEHFLRVTLRESYPDYAYLGEEHGRHGDSSECLWVIDPIDGTVSFSHDLPFFATLLALMDEARPVVAVVDLPALDSIFYATQDGGAFENGRRITVGTGFDPARDVVCRGEAYAFELAGQTRILDVLTKQVTHCRTYCDAHGHTLVARGSAALMVDAAMEVWDSASVSLLMAEAGGAVVTLPDYGSDERSTIISGRPDAVNWLVQALEGE